MIASSSSIIITGASTGIGRQCAIDLANAGFHIFAGVRQQFESFPETRGQITPVFIDVTQQESIQAAVSDIQKHVGGKGLFALINNAGIGVGGPLECIPVDDIRHQFEVNVFGQIAVTQAFLPMLRHYGRDSKIINMSSISGRSILPFASPYGASKHALEAFSDALRLELSPWGIQVVLIEPGVIQTPIWDKSIASNTERYERLSEAHQGYYGAVLQHMSAYLQRASERGVSPQAVSQAVLKALQTPKSKARYLVGNDAKLSALINKLPNGILDKLILKKFSSFAAKTS